MKYETAIIFFASFGLAKAAPLSDAKRAALDFGTCSDPAILFGPGFDGRNQNSFKPANSAQFNHGSALNIGVIASFICGQLESSCHAGADAISACATGQTAAAAATGQAAADAFNSALGVSATTAPAAVPLPAASATAPAQAKSASTSNASTASSSNVQKFTGALGGAPPPVIFTPGAARPFAVDGSTDVNKGAAIQRSCDVQKNACANAANSGALAGGVGQCDTQHSACIAANA